MAGIDTSSNLSCDQRLFEDVGYSSIHRPVLKQDTVTPPVIAKRHYCILGACIACHQKMVGGHYGVKNNKIAPHLQYAMLDAQEIDG